MDTRRQMLPFSWGEVSYLEWLPEGEPASTVLLLHGGGLDSAALSWGEVGPALAAAGHRVLAPDHPGYGESPPAWPATHGRLVAYVGEFVDALGLDRYVIGGLSLGGGMALGHVLRRPRGVAGVILLGSYGLMDRQFEGPLAAPLHVVTWVMLRSGMLGAVMKLYGASRTLMATSVRGLIRNPEQRTPELLDAIMDAARGSSFEAFEQWQRDQFLWNHLNTNYTDRLGSVACPVLIVHGDHDSGVPVACAERAAAQLPDAELLVVRDAGHWVQRDRPEVVAPAMKDFIARLGEATPSS
ncbi:MAG: alpha/beta hydrolase [Propioniciclava sp.]|uniref:alpha/beta fold hydrolase n=1 Tax=Propioniciclava sp. TaxID=2038686 RepID=UPI0039E69247